MIRHRHVPSFDTGAVMALAFCLLFAFCSAAHSQEAVAESAQKRPRPEFDAVGFELDRLFTDVAATVKGRTASDPERPRGAFSSFLVFPKLELDLTHTDNLYRAHTNKRAEFVTVARPAVEIKSDWDNHSLGFSAGAGVGRHNRTASEDYDDYKFATNGVLAVDDLTNINGSAAAEHGHEQRGTVDDPGANFGPTFVDVYKFSLGGEHRVPDGILVRPYVGLSQFRYRDNGAIDNSDRRRDEYKYRLRLGYEFTPGTTVFVQPDYTSIVYRQTFDRNGLRRDTQLLEFLTGVTWDTSPVTFLEASVGFLSAGFDDPAFSDETNPLARLDLTWNATSLVTVNASIDRTFNPTATIGLAGTIDSVFRTSVDWEAFYGVILGAGYVYRNEEFIDAVPEHSRASHQVSASARWLINENFFARGEITHESRSGDDPFDSLERNQILATFGAQL